MVTLGLELAAPGDTLHGRLGAEFDAMPGLRLTHAQIRRLLDVSDAECTGLLDQLAAFGAVAQDPSGRYLRGRTRP